MSVKLHARLGASGAKRWMTCPGSIALSEGQPDIQSVFAAEGDRAHDLAEICLKRGTDPDDYLGAVLPEQSEPIDEAMAEHVATFVNHCREYMTDPWQFWIEKQFNLSAHLNTPEPMFGTSDFAAYHPVTHHLKICDLKYGVGIVVEVDDNVQTMYYALGVALELHPLPITGITLTIVQPRVGHVDGHIRSIEISYLDLIEFANRLLAAARRTIQPNAPLVAGEHCRFCPASGICPEQHRVAVELAQVDFAIEESVPPAPATMPVSMIAEMLPKMDVLEDWIKACRARVVQALEAGEEVPGFKLVAKRGVRKWTDEQAVADTLLREKKLVEGDIFEPRELKSVAQIEKAMGKKAFKTSEVAGLVEKVSSGYKLAPDSDPAPAISVTGGEEFLALPAGNDTQDKQQGDN